MRTVLWLPYGLVCAIALPLKGLLALAIRAAWFRSRGATCCSPFVSMQADIEPNVRLGARVEVAAGVAIGAYTYVNADSVIESGAIGRFCSIASRASIGPTEHPYEQFSTHPVAFDGPQWGRPGRMPPQRKKPPSIGNDVWIGRGAVVMRGVEIGDGAVIGANAVVTHDVPPYAVACGVPARVVRYRFDEPVILRLRESRWWEKLDDVPRLISAMGAEWKTALKA